MILEDGTEFAVSLSRSSSNGGFAEVDGDPNYLSAAIASEGVKLRREDGELKNVTVDVLGGRFRVRTIS
ncbi:MULTISPECIES: hypothetical protein [Neorhizobium]|uniref:hypothetical protein n=1 Tax=Neorhizobium TaxID=1525371 RepID=UPI000CF87CE9|nr:MULTISPECIES: hypothetical protein [Neorhizobium]